MTLAAIGVPPDNHGILSRRDVPVRRCVWQRVHGAKQPSNGLGGQEGGIPTAHRRRSKVRDPFSWGEIVSHAWPTIKRNPFVRRVLTCSLARYFALSCDPSLITRSGIRRGKSQWRCTQHLKSPQPEGAGHLIAGRAAGAL